MNNVNSEVYMDISIIIGMMPNEMRNRISKGFINFVESNKANNYVSNINPQIPLKEQNIRKETKEMLGIIYRDYLCDEEERVNLLEKEKKELLELEAQKREKYNPDNIFKKNDLKENIKEDIVTNEVAMVEYKEKESIITKIINKIKSFLHLY